MFERPREFERCGFKLMGERSPNGRSGVAVDSLTETSSGLSVLCALEEVGVVEVVKKSQLLLPFLIKSDIGWPDVSVQNLVFEKELDCVEYSAKNVANFRGLQCGLSLHLHLPGNGK